MSMSPCTCLPRSPDDQCPTHGYEEWLRSKDAPVFGNRFATFGIEELEDDPEFVLVSTLDVLGWSSPYWFRAYRR